MKKTLSLAMLLLLLVLAATAADSGFNGSWNAEVPRGNGRIIPAVFSFEMDGTTLLGSVHALDQDFELTNGKVNGDEISFTVAGATGEFSGKLEGSEIKMKVKYDGGENGKRTMAFVATRAK
jgi:hypothetical protein